MVEVKNNTPSLNDERIKSATGKTWKQWFEVLDKFGGVEKGRRAMGDYLVGECKVDPWWSATMIVQYEAAHKIVEKDGRPKGYMICVSKTVNAPVEKIFAAFSDAKEMDKWYSSKTKLDFKENGRYANADGDAGEFKKIRPNKAIRFTWENKRYTAGTFIDLTFQSKGDKKCAVMIAHDRIQTRQEADDLRAGWGWALDLLKSYLETGKQISYADWETAQK